MATTSVGPSTLIGTPTRGRPGNYTLEATVIDVNRQSVAATASGIVHPASFYLAARPTGDYFWTGGRAQKIDLLAVRPEEILVGPAARAAARHLVARIRSVQFLGSFTRLGVVLPGDGEVTVECDVAANAFAELGVKEGADLPVAFRPESLRVFPKDG